MDTLRFQVTGRREFERLHRSDPSTLTDLERAARFLYLQRTAYGGKVAGRAFGVDVGAPARFDLNKLGSLLADVHERLAGVIIENLPWRALLDRYDRPETLFYLDLPYWGSEGVYGKALFSRDEFGTLAERVSYLRGGFILSINDVPEVRKPFGSFELEGVDLGYSISGARTQARELIVRG
jgi:DNA adenine methylase